MPTVQTDLWFDTEALEAAEYWTSLVPGSRILEVFRDQGGNPHTQEGGVVYVSFELNGQRFGAVNGGPHFPLTEAVSISLTCDDQAEADRYWEELTREGSESMCGWCKDRCGMSWQIVPRGFMDLQSSRDPAPNHIEGARHTVTDPAHGTSALIVEDAAGDEYIAFRWEGFEGADDPRTLTQFWVDPLDDGTAMVRVLESGFRGGGASDELLRQSHDDQVGRWRMELEALRAHFAQV